MKLIDQIRDHTGANLIFRKLLALGFTYVDKDDYILIVSRRNTKMQYVVENWMGVLNFYYGFLEASDPTLIVTPVDSF